MIINKIVKKKVAKNHKIPKLKHVTKTQIISSLLLKKFIFI